MPTAMMSKLLGNPSDMFDAFLAIEPDTSFDWFTNYFQEQHSNREAMMQDFTPAELTQLLPELASVQYSSCLDVCAGTGGLSIPVLTKNPSCEMYAIELSKRALPLLLFNLMIRNASGYVLNGDVLTDTYETIYRLERGERYSTISTVDSLPDKEYQTDICVTNPPYSLAHKWSKGYTDNRFARYGYPSTQYNDFSFVLHGLYHLKEGGELFAILPHGVLFRAGAEETIRKSLIEAKQLYAVIGLPEKLFQNTAIPTCIMALKKTGGDGSVLLIDAKDECEEFAKFNKLTSKGLHKVQLAYETRANIEKFSHVATPEELETNNHNLNISRYVSNFEAKEIPSLRNSINSLNLAEEEKAATSASLLEMLKEITSENEDYVVQLAKFSDWLEKEAQSVRDYSRFSDTPTFQYRTVKLTDLGHMERAQNRKVYPSGSLYIRVSACSKNDDDKWNRTDKDQLLESKYAVFIPDDDRNDDPVYLQSVFEAFAPEFFANYVGDAINISMDLFDWYKVAYTSNRAEQLVVRAHMLELEALEKQTRQNLETMQDIKAWLMDKMFV